MKWISYAEFENYKILSKHRFEFGKLMNVITGPSSAGKSTMIKGIRKCLLNKPDIKGEKLLTWQAPRGAKVHIRVGIKDDHDGKYTEEEAPETTVERVLGKSGVNEYYIHWPDGTTTNYAKFGKNVPPEVMEVHGMREVDMGYGKEHLNYLGQFDGFFLVSKRPEEVATALGRLAQTDVIDKVKQGLRSDISSNTRTMGAIKSNIAKEEEVIASFGHLNDIGDALEALDAIRASIKEDEDLATAAEAIGDKLSAKAERLEDLIDELGDSLDYAKAIKLLDEAIPDAMTSALLKRILKNNINNRAEDLQDVIERLSEAIDIKDVEKRIVELELLREQIDKLDSIKRKIRRKANALNDLVEDMEPVDFTEFNELVEEAEGALAKLSSVARVKDKVMFLATELIKQITATDDALISSDKAMDKLVEAMEGRCPVCGSDVEDLDTVLAHIEAQ